MIKQVMVGRGEGLDSHICGRPRPWTAEAELPWMALLRSTDVAIQSLADKARFNQPQEVAIRDNVVPWEKYKKF